MQATAQAAPHHTPITSQAKRKKGTAVVPPLQERFPDGSMSLEQVEQRFAELKQKVGGGMLKFTMGLVCGHLHSLQWPGS